MSATTGSLFSFLRTSGSSSPARCNGDDVVEVVHEALIQRWGQLRAWLETDRAFRTWQEGLDRTP